MVSSVFYNGDGSTRIFPVSFKILGDAYVRVYVNDVEVIDKTKYDIINNSVVFITSETPAVGTDNVKIYVATSSSELGDLGAPLTDISSVANNLVGIISVNNTVVPNLPEILLADNNATIATTKASEATSQANIATTQAGIAVTNAGLALTYKDSAETAKNTAVTQAGIATTKAQEAVVSASNAQASVLIVNAYANVNWAGFTVSDGDLIVEYFNGSTSTPSLVNGELILTY